MTGEYSLSEQSYQEIWEPWWSTHIGSLSGNVGRALSPVIIAFLHFTLYLESKVFHTWLVQELSSSLSSSLGGWEISAIMGVNFPNWFGPMNRLMNCWHVWLVLALLQLRRFFLDLVILRACQWHAPRMWVCLYWTHTYPCSK